METLLVVIFVVGYLAITLEHNLKIDKLIPALAMMAIMWALMTFGLLHGLIREATPYWKTLVLWGMMRKCISWRKHCSIT